MSYIFLENIFLFIKVSSLFKLLTILFNEKYFFFYSIILTAQANGMDVEKYLTDLFSNSAGTILLPWND